MNTKFEYPKVDDALMAEVVSRLCKAGDPEKIILFGSHARGDAHDESDLDILVIEDSNVPRYQREAKYRRPLRDMMISKDILVWTPDEIEEWSEVKSHLITTIMREGKILYEKEN